MDNRIRKLRQSSRNRESYDELMELEAELRQAYVAKELQAQLLEKETERYIESVRNQHAVNLMRLEEQKALDDYLRQKAKDLRKSEDYKRQLKEQIIQKQEENNTMKQEARKEREVLIEVDRIREERDTIKAIEKKVELSEDMRRQRLILTEMKLIRDHEDKEAEQRKDIENQIYLEDIDERVRKAKELREEQIRVRERAMDEIATILINTETHKREKERLIGELLAEDVNREILRKENEEAIKRMKMKEELAAGLKEQIIFMEHCKLHFVEQDRAFAEEIMKKVMENEKTERLTAAAKRRMQAQYREDLNRLIEKRHQIREEEILKMEEAAKEESRQLRMFSDRMKEERKRLLENHATNVADFLNKGVLTEEEREIITQM
ncbi:uncharacterized protein LOC143178285 [Calliopsis andreniformis]|uniref:uncharacterized protein LOC143178285 n=1 Tax=Calliopsis andreniformis TaxID=337506 RepID=UPI003FCCD170